MSDEYDGTLDYEEGARMQSNERNIFRARQALRTRTGARKYAVERAAATGLDEVGADAVAERVMVIYDPEYTLREWNNFIDEEIRNHEDSTK